MSKNKKCLIVVDYQNDFVTGSLGFDRAKELEKPIAEKIKKYLKEDDEVVFTLDTHTDDYLKTREGELLPVPHCISGTAGHRLYGEVGELSKNCRKFLKPSFGSRELFEYLLKNPFESIELVGVVTNVCVISNAVLAKTAQPETPVIVDGKCVASNSDELNCAALAIMESFQVKVM